MPHLKRVNGKTVVISLRSLFSLAVIFDFVVIHAHAHSRADARTCGHMQTHENAHTNTHTHIHTHAHTCTHTHTRAHTCARTPFTRTHSHTHVNVCAFPGTGTEPSAAGKDLGCYPSRTSKLSLFLPVLCLLVNLPCCKAVLFVQSDYL
jgi:hypothetical protein